MIFYFLFSLATSSCYPVFTCYESIYHVLDSITGSQSGETSRVMPQLSPYLTHHIETGMELLHLQAPRCREMFDRDD